jgi:hypothetical protein
MTTVLPTDYVTLIEAAEMLQTAMHAGVPDLPTVTKLRQKGLEVNDGPARDRPIAELWKAVDKGTLRSLAIGGRPRRVVRLDAQFTRSVPGLRSPRGRGFTLLRQSNPAYQQLADWFGPSFYTATVAFLLTEVQKLTRRLLRARRTAKRTNGQKRDRGRPSLIATVQRVISDVVDGRKWDATMTMKALTREVNRAGKWDRPVSQDTVTRALEGLYEQTGDRRFERVRQPRLARSSGSNLSSQV